MVLEEEFPEKREVVMSWENMKTKHSVSCSPESKKKMVGTLGKAAFS